jgi:DNA-binding NarL/FixJ family response regulator
MSNIQVMITDDHQIIIDGIIAVLEKTSGFEIAGYANSGREAIALQESVNPDVIIMDVDMPGMNGLVAVEEIMKSNPSRKIIMLSLHLEPTIIKQAISAGAKGYLPKNVSAEELTNALKTVHLVGTWFSGDLTLSLSGNIPSNRISMRPEEGDSAKLTELSEREIEILKAIAEGQSSTEIAEVLFISARTVDTHRSNIMKKLQTNKVAGLIRFALKNGLVN